MHAWPKPTRDRVLLKYPEAVDAEPLDGHGPTYRWWRLSYPCGRKVEVVFCPRATRERVRTTYTEVVDASPFEPAVAPPGAPMTPEEERTIRAWLASIGEDDQAIVEEVVTRCRRDPVARAYFLARAGELPEDDRRRCWICRRFRADGAPETGYCTAYKAHVVDRPPRRCLEYHPRAGDSDQRTGRERWPGRGGRP